MTPLGDDGTAAIDAQDKGLAEAQLGDASDTLKRFGAQDRLRGWGAAISFGFGVLIIASALLWAACMFTHPPDYFSALKDPTVQIALIVSKSLGVLATLSFGFAMMRLAQSLSIPLLIEAERARDEKDTGLSDIGTGIGKVAEAIKGFARK